MRQGFSYLLIVTWLLVCSTLAAADELPRQVNVSGAASLTASPDRASLRLGIQARNRSLEAARERVATVAGDFLALCKKLGIPEKKIQTTGLSMRPEYRWNRDGREIA